jgi:UDPglucose 6-dehydrogenase
VASTIAEQMESHKIAEDRSTVPVGTGDRVKAKMAEVQESKDKSQLTFDVISNPELLKKAPPWPTV